MKVEWKPIETAPRDETPILGVAGYEMATVYWFEDGEYWNLCVCGSFAEDAEWTPTHWRSLPKLPDC